MIYHLKAADTLNFCFHKQVWGTGIHFCMNRTWFDLKEFPIDEVQTNSPLQVVTSELPIYVNRNENNN